MGYSPVRQIDNILAVVGLLAALPALYFVGGSVLKYEMNLLPNVNIVPLPPIVLVGGLFIAIVLNFYSLLHQRASSAVSALEIVKTRPLNVVVFVVGVLLLTLLLGYVVVENLLEMQSSANV